MCKKWLNYVQMHYFITMYYADLSKSKKLTKCVMDMNNHYLELLCFLNEVQGNPESKTGGISV